MLPRRRVIRFRNGIADNLPAKKITGLAECGCAGIAKEHQILRLQHNNVIFFCVGSLPFASPGQQKPRTAQRSAMREITGYPSLAARLRCCAVGTYTPSNGGVTSKSTAYSFYRNMNWGTPLPDFFRRQLEARCVERHEGIDWGYHNECASGAIAFLG